MHPPACGRFPAAGILRVPTSTEPVLTSPDLSTEPLIDRLRRATIGRYDVYAELGAGGMATVFLALDLALERKVAIKVMSPALLSTAGAIERFRREARVAAALSHPHIVPIHAIGEEPGLAYYVMKYVEGTSLDAVLRLGGRQDVAFAQAILGYAGSALHYAHQRGVVHRDVKPANIMLDREGWCYVTDFGIAKAEDGAGLTKSGVIIGTPHYMCPEQFNGQPVTGAADQYALGVVAFELLTGAPPYGGPSIGEVMRGHLLEPIPPLRELRPDVPAALEATVERMLAKDPAQRFPSLADALESFGRVSASQEREVRERIAGLAAEGATHQPVLAVPTSPVPMQRPTVHHEVTAAPTRPITVPIRTPVTASPVAPTAASAKPPATSAVRQAPPGMRKRAWPVLLGLAGVAAAILAWTWTSRPSSTATPPSSRGPAVVRAPSAAPNPSSPASAATGAPAGQETRPVAGQTDLPPATPNATDVPPAGASGTAPVTRRQVANGAARDRGTLLPNGRPRPGAIRERLDEINQRRVEAGQAPIEAAAVQIGSRLPLAVLYVNGITRGVIGQKPAQLVPVAAGRVTLSIRAENCRPWDTTLVAVAGQRYLVGYRSPYC